MNSSLSGARATGFTLFELVIVILVVAILVGVAVPSFRYVTVSNRMSAEMNTLVADLQYARSEAIKEGLPVTVCAANNALNNCSNNSTWSTGWIVFVDSNANKSFDNNQDLMLRTRPAFTASGSTDTLVASSNQAKAFLFNREGYASTGVATVINMKLHSAPVVNTWTRCLQVTPVGSLSVVLYGAGSPACT